MKTTAYEEHHGLVQSEESGVRSPNFTKDVNHAEIDHADRNNVVIDTASTDRAVIHATDTDTDHADTHSVIDTAVAKTTSSPSILNQPVLQVEHLSRTYAGADRPAVNDISFTLNRGECLGLVGGAAAARVRSPAVCCGLKMQIQAQFHWGTGYRAAERPTVAISSAEDADCIPESDGCTESEAQDCRFTN